MTTIDPNGSSSAELVKRLAEELIWEFPPRWVELTSELDPSDGVPPEWAATVKSSFTEPIDEPGGAVVQRWYVWVGHDDTGKPIGARLACGPLEITHSGWSGECQKTLAEDELVDYELDNQHIHRRWHLASGGGHRVSVGTAIDPLSLIAAIVKARRDARVGERDDQPPGDRWRRAVVELVARKRRVVPDDLLPLLADATIKPLWGSGTAWLGTPEALVVSKVSVRCRQIPDSKRADYEVRMRFSGQLEESGREACAIADDLAEMLRHHYVRTFEVIVTDTVTGIRGTSGELP